ncbi:pentapeptide repeat-containing protein [Campylobacter jejuni]|uniref:pentapeptide repeat-containing protein n=1 Tax=Campylobacter jejuni TaxID=197 RepID=UPI002043A64F|nr:pentapeptide repeat-containing protein [Campylobacter jejuni]
MIKETLEKILNTLEKCCEETHQNHKSESDGKETADIDELSNDIDELSKVLSIDKRYIFAPSHKETNEIIEKIKGKEDFRQRDDLFSSDEKWYLVCGKEDSKIDISLYNNKVKKIPCNVIFNNYNIDLHIDESKGVKKDNTETIKNHLYFYNCAFEKGLIKLTNIIFEKTLTFNQCNIESEVQIYKNRFSSHLVFRDCYDKQSKKITSLDLQENKFEGYLFIKNCAIEKINLWKNKFKNRCYFMDSVFGNKNNENIKLNFSNAHFEDNAYFNNSEFYSYADFHECEFDDIACFYGVKFHKIPNFSQVVLKGNFNALNITSNFVFDDLKKQIKQEYENFNKDIKEKENKKPLDKFANDFRDSFRIFKSALIKDNNLLDASNFHKYELYCKEIELKQNWDKKGENVKNMTNLEKNISRIRDFVDFLLLGFYRKLCDHHTDFLKVFNNLILLIALYALFVFGFTWLHDDKLEDTRAILTLFGFFDKLKFCFNIGVGIFIALGFILVLYKIDKNFIKSFLNILKIFQSLSHIRKWLLKIFKKEIFVKLSLALKIILLDLGFLVESLIIIFFIPCVFYVLFLLFGFFLNLGKDFGYSLLINTLFVSLYICLVYTKSLFFGRYVVLIFSYIGFIIMLIKQPNIIHPLIGKIANESDKFFNYPSLIVLNILYTILLALVLFSLQKTARKNSIVPS